MKIFAADGRLDTALFAAEITWCNVPGEALKAAIETRSPRVESTHFLVALAEIAGGCTQAGLAARRMSPQAWQAGLKTAVLGSETPVYLSALTAEALHETAVTMLELAASECQDMGAAGISENVLLRAALLNLTPRAARHLDSCQIDVEEWCRELKAAIGAIQEPIEVFHADGRVKLEAFSARARHTLVLLRRETQALGYEKADARHLAIALLNDEGSVLAQTLRARAVPMRSLQEALSASLRTRARRTPSVIDLERSKLQALLIEILEQAGRFAQARGAQRIHQRHIVEALLDIESSARALLVQAHIDPVHLRAELSEGLDSDEEELEASDDPTVADVEAVGAALRSRLVGQDPAIDLVLPYVQRLRFGFRIPSRPLGVFLFCGPSGSGKTAMAKQLARAIFGSEDNLIFMEMGQFNAPESINIFVGAAPGYVGYGEGKLTNGLRDKPKCVVLFDEIEKAHAKVLDALLRFLDEGKIDDPAGPVRDGSECIVIMTSNVGAAELGARAGAGAQAADPEPHLAERARLRALFRQHNFRVEFLNRVDELVLFRPLSQDDFTEITRRLLDQLIGRLKREHDLEIQVDPVLTEQIGAHCVKVEEGARTALRLVKLAVLNPAIDFVMRDGRTSARRVKISHARRLSADAEPRGVVEWLP